MNSVTYEPNGLYVMQMFGGVARQICECTSRDAAERIAAMLTVFGHLSLDGIAEAGKRLATETVKFMERA